MMYIFWITIMFDLAFATMYYGMAKAIARRRVSGEAQWAMYGFTTWWAALAFMGIVGVLAKFYQHFVGWSVAAYIGYVSVVVVLLMYALAGLQYYFVYLVSGRWGAWKPVLAYYLALIGYTMYFVIAGDPISVGVNEVTGAIQTENANDLSGSAQGLYFSLALLLPVFIGAVAYASFFFKVNDRSQKFRVAMVSIGFIVWFGVALGGSFGGGGGDSLTWTLFSRVIALLAIWMNYQAFRPSKWVQKRFRIQPI